jgi:hypothetical protein
MLDFHWRIQCARCQGVRRKIRRGFQQSRRRRSEIGTRRAPNQHRYGAFVCKRSSRHSVTVALTIGGGERAGRGHGAEADQRIVFRAIWQILGKKTDEHRPLFQGEKAKEDRRFESPAPPTRHCEPQVRLATISVLPSSSFCRTRGPVCGNLRPDSCLSERMGLV